MFLIDSFLSYFPVFTDLRSGASFIYQYINATQQWVTNLGSSCPTSAYWTTVNAGYGYSVSMSDTLAIYGAPYIGELNDWCSDMFCEDWFVLWRFVWFVPHNIIFICLKSLTFSLFPSGVSFFWTFSNGVWAAKVGLYATVQGTGCGFSVSTNGNYLVTGAPNGTFYSKFRAICLLWLLTMMFLLVFLRKSFLDFQLLWSRAQN